MSCDNGSMRVAARLVVGMLFLLPVVASAQTADELRAQAQALLAKVQQLQAQLGAGGSTTISGVNIDSSSCPNIGRTLKPGSTGDDVMRLQQFLARDPAIYPEGLTTGYYGALTEAAVRRWQAKYNVVSSGTLETTGYGQVGPRTAAAIAILCSTGSYNGIPGPGPGGGSPNVGGFIQVTPIAGNSPLSVAVQVTVNTVNSCAGAIYTLDYGDRTIPSQIAVPAGQCAQMTQILAHIYQYGGTYQITLSSGGHRTSATVQVFGQGPPGPGPIPGPSKDDSVSASPTSGQAPVLVRFSGIVNGSASCGGGSYYLDFGNGQGTTIPYPADGCKAYEYEVEHTYTTGGTFIAKLYRGPNASGVSVANVTITISSPPQAPGSWGIIAITPAVGGNPFTVSIEFEYPTCAAFSIDWGDGSLPETSAGQTGCGGGTAKATYSHTYATGGQFTISLRDGNGVVKATASATIVN